MKKVFIILLSMIILTSICSTSIAMTITIDLENASLDELIQLKALIDARIEKISGSSEQPDLSKTDNEGVFPVCQIIRESVSQNDFDTIMVERGYVGTQNPSITDTVFYENDEADPYRLMILFTGSNPVTTGRGIIYYRKDGTAFSRLVSYLTDQFGDPAPTPSKQKSGESLNWKDGEKTFSLTVVGTIDNAKAGNEEYYLIINNDQ